MARQESMAAIDASLAGNTTSTPDNNSVTSPSPLPELTANQKRAIDVQRQRQKDIQDQLQQGELQQGELQSSFRTALSSIWRGTAVKLEQLQLPGGIALPLIILFIFFLLLLPVNGHTRLVWLWLSLTGNASITPSTNQSSQIGGIASSDFSLSVPGNNQIPTPTTATFMTGVEDI